MTFEAWVFSAKRAWQNPWVKAVTIATVAFVVVTTVWFCGRVISLRGLNEGRLVWHYTVEGGIDAIRAWQWLLVLPLAWLSLTTLDILWALGVYRHDAQQAWAFLGLAFGFSIPWMMALWHLIRINQ